MRASKELRLAYRTISGQIHRLEEILGEKRFSRKGRNLALTDVGRASSSRPARLGLKKRGRLFAAPNELIKLRYYA